MDASFDSHRPLSGPVIAAAPAAPAAVATGGGLRRITPPPAAPDTSRRETSLPFVVSTPRRDDDPATGLLSLHAFACRIADDAHRAQVADIPVTVAVLTLDGLARMTAEGGDVDADVVLAAVAERLRGFAEPWEALGRLAGDRIGWILPGVDAEHAVRVLEGVRSEFAEAPPAAPVGTVSAGVCTSAPGVPGAALLRHAEDALRMAARRGGDRIVVHAPPTPPQAGVPAASPSQPDPREALARALAARHPDTRRHCARVAALADRLAEELGWDVAGRRRLMEAADLHDVGKLAIPDALLDATDRLGPQERWLIHRHPEYGVALLDGVLDTEQISWVRHHHERWDGGGYPDGVAGAAIGLGARIIAVADSVDAMTTPRPYRPLVTMAEAIAECIACRGTQFDPDVVDALVRTVGGHRDPAEHRGGSSAG